MKWMTLKILIILLVLASGTLKAQIFVSPGGDDTNPGTISLPFKTLSKAISVASPDSLIYMRGGPYVYSSKETISKSGSAGHYIKVWAYPGETPVLDFSLEPGGTDGISLSGSYFHLKGLEVKKSGHNGIYITGNYNIIENCVIHDNLNTGLHMRHGASYNLILNCDSFLNYDPPIGGNADGFSAKWEVGPGNIFRGCRSYNNSDDGWDLWMGQNPVLIEGCWAFRNGVDSWHSGSFNGNGNGFKLGGSNVPAPHTVKNCVAFDNAGNTGKGFDENNNLAGQTLYNCTSFHNLGLNYSFPNTVTQGGHVIKNCIAFPESVRITSGIQEANSWQGFTVSNSDFTSLDTALALAPRDTDGSLPANAFLHLAAVSPMIDAGLYVGIPYNGTAPDLGAFESGITLMRTLTVIAANGTVLKYPNLPLYANGTSVQLTPVPEAGHYFLAWNDSLSGNSVPGTILMNSDKIVTANFAVIQYTITASAGPHGSISPSGPVPADYGSEKLFTVTPDTGYHIDSVYVDGIYAGDSSNYTFTNIMTDHSIRASFAQSSVTIHLTFNYSWNLVSLPVMTENAGVQQIFQRAVSNAFMYSSRYLSRDTLTPGSGYWVKLSARETVNVAGLPISAESVEVRTGWNMIGSISAPVPISLITSEPPGIGTSGFFAYDSSYKTTDTIRPGRGFWVKVNQSGKLILSAGQLASRAAFIRISPSRELPPLPPYEISSLQRAVPDLYLLEEVYPNPFNGAARISYQLPLESRVSLRVYNTLGKLVSVLESGVESAGYRSLEWGASNMASGVYFCALETISLADPSVTFHQTRKMLLLR